MKRPIVAKRLADKEVYLSEDRFKKPKEYFKLIASQVRKKGLTPRSAIDVGCATGELLYFLSREFSSLSELTGIDVVEEFFPRARQMLPQARFQVGNLDDPKFEAGRIADLVTMCGVLGCLFEPELALRNTASLIKPGGLGMMFSAFNEEPVDVQLFYRRADGKSGWETGHNAWSIKTIDGLLRELGFETEWIDFRMPIPIPKTSDPLRTWSEPFRDNPNQLFSGTGQIKTQKLVTFRRKR